MRHIPPGHGVTGLATSYIFLTLFRKKRCSGCSGCSGALDNLEPDMTGKKTFNPTALAPTTITRMQSWQEARRRRDMCGGMCRMGGKQQEWARTDQGKWVKLAAAPAPRTDDSPMLGHSLRTLDALRNDVPNVSHSTLIVAVTLTLVRFVVSLALAITLCTASPGRHHNRVTIQSGSAGCYI